MVGVKKKRKREERSADPIPKQSNNEEEFDEIRINPFKFFKLILHQTLDQKRLRVPETFAKVFTHGLPTFATLTIPTGLSWNVILDKIENRLYFTERWADFMQQNDIKYGYFLEFEYVGNKKFNVNILDLSCCEINYPREYDRHTKQKVPQNREHDAKVKEEIEEEEDEEEEDIRRGGTILENNNSTSPFFTITVRRYSISANCYLHLPKSFTNEHMKRNSYKAVKLLAGDHGREWHVECYFCGGDVRLIGSGWKTFMLENKWKEGEKYTFVLVDKKRNTTATFKVFKE